MSAIKRHGGKHYLAKQIVALFPQRVASGNNPGDDTGYLTYVEPFFGGGSVLFANDPIGISEVINDLDWQVSNFWRVLQSEKLFEHFARLILVTPMSENEFRQPIRAHEITQFEPSVEHAVRFFVRNRQSRQGLEKDFATLTKKRTRRGMNEQVSAWLSAVDSLPEFHERLSRVMVLNSPALEVIRRTDDVRTLFYLDPPYVHSTRSTTGEYRHEMTLADHEQLLAALMNVKGRFLLSGYRCELYDEYASFNDWHRVDFEIDNKASGSKTKAKKVESVWMNY